MGRSYDGLSGLLKPPTRFMYCLYSVFFSFLTAYNLSLPGTFVFFVDLNVANPIIFCICSCNSSSDVFPVSISIFPELPFVTLSFGFDFGFGFTGGADLACETGSVGGGRSLGGGRSVGGGHFSE